MESRHYIPLELSNRGFPNPWDEEYIIEVDDYENKTVSRIFNEIKWKQDIGDWVLEHLFEIRVVNKQLQEEEE